MPHFGGIWGQNRNIEHQYLLLLLICNLLSQPTHDAAAAVQLILYPTHTMRGFCVLFDATDAGDAKKRSRRKQVCNGRNRRNGRNARIEMLSIPALIVNEDLLRTLRALRWTETI